MQARFIFNPHSGRNRRNPRLHGCARAFIAREGWEAAVVTTEHPGHATELARQAVADGCSLVVAIGGDGTMNEVATALVGTEVVLGLIPGGSGNGLGRHLGIPGPGRVAFHTLRSGRPRTIDTGLINGRPFFNAAGMGFEALIAREFSTLTRRGLTGYLHTSARAWWNYQPPRYGVQAAGGAPREFAAFTLALANSAQYGNHALIAPGASVIDGRLDLAAVPRVGPANALPLVWRLFRGTLDRAPGMVRLQDTAFVIERAAPGWIHTDGEPHAESARLEVAVRPASLRVLTPDQRPI